MQLKAWQRERGDSSIERGQGEVAEREVGEKAGRGDRESGTDRRGRAATLIHWRW